MAVRSLLQNKTPKAVTIEAGASLSSAVRLLMKHNIGGLPVVADDNSPVGFLAERDVVRVVDEHPDGIGNLRVKDVARRPAPTCQADDPLHEVMARMTRDRLRHLVVVDGKGIEGVISVGDLVKHRLRQLETETGVLRDYVAAQRALR